MIHDPVNNVLTAREIIKWITTQCNGQGGFYSTHDTIVALQALATYEGHLRQGTLNVKAVVTASNFTHTINITDNNKLLEQYQPLPTTVSINMSGQGCAVLQTLVTLHPPLTTPEGQLSGVPASPLPLACQARQLPPASHTSDTTTTHASSAHLRAALQVQPAHTTALHTRTVTPSTDSSCSVYCFCDFVD
ncbi:hypothetical protein Pcinc_003715 [Petrolisthes cinctipes]|uniref:Alpha-macroglobulin-like TED domain-containing protein n=1 Tax=Petrolisthes cinctipes TaxID=88211 RepID=A0AAE1GFX6_PETCI|nr:hypothetical protein Pcinc_003715 [Petrolisthes cinctipes]